MRYDDDVPAIDFPATIVVDSREGLPFTFAGMRGDSRQKYAPFNVRTVVSGLQSGDYSLEGYEPHIAVERKSLADLFGTIGQGRERFERELCRLACFEFSAVVVEADWHTVITNPPPHSQLDPKIVYRSVITWQQRYPGTHWWFCPDRQFAEITTFRILERFYRDAVAGRTRSSSFATWKGKTFAEAILALDGEELDLGGVSF